MGKAFARRVQKKQELVFNKNYLGRCQIATPDKIAKWVWSMVHGIKGKNFSSVLDLGCGDARFSLHGSYDNYQGVEIDRNHAIIKNLPDHAEIIHDCALLSDFDDFDLCIGNPPYVRHHDMDNHWREAIVKCLGEKANIKLDQRGNAFLYFMLKALLATKENGLVALVVPFEWVSRPSSAWLRRYIEDKGWSVTVYRLPEGVFSGVLTTSSLSIIDKSTSQTTWCFYNVNDEFGLTKIKNPSGTRCKVLKYERRHNSVYAQRGLSPGTQAIFCITEEARLFHRLKKERDVIPCLTSTKQLPDDAKILTKKVFKEYYIDTASRCWLIRSDKELSPELANYLKHVDVELRSTATCLIRDIWYKYKFSKAPELLLGTGFVKHGPQIVENQIGAVAVGSVGNIYVKRPYSKRMIAYQLRKFDFEKRVVNQSGRLKKIEINQLNSVLRSFIKVSNR